MASELNTENWSLIGERHQLWRGACGGVWAEGTIYINAKAYIIYLLQKVELCGNACC